MIELASLLSTLAGYILFIVSEFLPFVNIPANGLLHVLSMGFSNSFKNPNTNITFAKNILDTSINSEKLSDFITKVNNNQFLIGLIDEIITNPGFFNDITMLQKNPQLLHFICSNELLNKVLCSLNNDPYLFNIVFQLTQNKNIYNSLLIQQILYNPEIFNELNNSLIVKKS